MCYLDSVPYLRETAIVLLLALFALSIFRKEKCPCKDEIERLAKELDALKRQGK
ncbi:MAG: hypothetical protein ACTTIC_03185 [Helicobacteraceae bacterium]